MRLDSIGDFVLFSASLVAYRILFPNAWLVLLVKENVYNLAETCPYVDEVWSLPYRKFRLNIAERLRWYRKMSAAGFDLAINAVFSCSFSFLDCLIGWTGAPRRVAFHSDCCDRLNGRQHQYYNEFVSAKEGISFEIDRNHEMLHHLGYGAGLTHKTEIWMKECDRRKARSHCQQFAGKPYAVLFPGALVMVKRWPAEKFISTVQEIHHQYPMHWAICGSADEAELCGYISSSLTNCSISNTNLAGKTSLREVAALTEKALFYLGNDSGGAHIAAAVDTPVICILGGGHIGRFYPYPGNNLTIAVTHELLCYSCNWQCIRPKAECITEIKVSAVVDKVVYLIQKSSDIGERSRA